MTDDDPEESGEKVVSCPVEGCDAEHPTRGLHLHLMRSVGDGHGEQGDYPDVDVDDLKEVGRQDVDVDYPNKRQSESTARMCAYCSSPFKGKGGVMRHLGLVEGRKDHPPNANALHEPEDFVKVRLDEDDNVVGVVESVSDDHEEVNREDGRHSEVQPSASFTKEEIAYIYEVMSEAGVDDEDFRMLLQQKFLQTLDREGGRTR